MIEQIKWLDLLASITSATNISPSEFWEMTFKELNSMQKEELTITRQDIEILMSKYPDAENK